MLPGSLVSGDVALFVSRVTVNGVNRPAVSISLDAAMRSDLPSQISGSGSGMSRSGTVEWATAEDVHERPVTAFRDWGVWRPQKGDEIIVYVGDGKTEWRRFTGVVDETTGSVGPGMQSTIVGNVDPLSASFSMEPQLTRMHPRSGSSTWRTGGLSKMMLIDEVLRRGGRYITPRNISGSVLNVPYQTSVRPVSSSFGELIQASRHTGDRPFHADMSTQWGFGAGDFTAQYDPSVSRTLSTPTHLSVMWGENHAGNASITLRYGAHYLRLLVAGNGNVIVQALVGDNFSELFRLPGSQLQDAYRAEVLIKNGQVILRTNNGAMVAGALPSGMGNPRLDRVDVTAWPDAAIAGLQVYHPPDDRFEWYTLNHTPSARILSTYGHVISWGQIQTTTRYRPQSVISALETMADETLSALWLDEYDTLWVAPSGALRNTPVSQTITTADDILSFSWSDRLLASASSVVVRYRVAALSYGMRQAVEVARGSKKRLTSTEVAEDIYSPGADEDWHGVNDNPWVMPGAGLDAYNRMLGSFIGVTYTRDGEPVEDQNAYSTTFNVTKTGISEWSVTQRVGNMPDNIVAETVTSPTNTHLWARNRDEPLPVFTAWAKAVWTDHETSTQTGVPGPILTVDLGPGTLIAIAEIIRDYLRDLIVNAHPQIRSMPVTPDPRRQLGDHIRIRSENFLGVTLRCLITGISESISADGGYEQQLDLDVINVDTGTLTYEEWEQAFPGTLTYEQWRTRLNTTDTYDDFNTDPLKGA